MYSQWRRLQESAEKVKQGDSTMLESMTFSNSSGAEEGSAVLVVGSTGSGKSSTIAKCTGQPVKVGDSDKSVTKTCQVYKVAGSG